MLKGLVSIVTGGASGLGKATVNHLSKKGGCVVLVDLPESKGQEIANSIDGNVVFSPCDVSSETDVMKTMSLCKEKFGRLDLAVNCAGLARAFKIANPVRQNVMRMEEMELIYRVNVYGTFNVTRLAAQLMSQNPANAEDKDRGLIINTASVSAEDGCIGQSAFSATKGAVAAMTLPLARDLSSLGIRVVAISPGLFETPLTSEVCLTKMVRNYFIEQILLPKRFGRPEEFAEMVETIVVNKVLNGEIVKMSGGLRFHVDVRVPVETNIEAKPKIIF